MPKTYSIIISDIVSEQLLARTLWSIAATAPEGLLEVTILEQQEMLVSKQFSSVMNIKQDWRGYGVGDYWIGIVGTPILTGGCLERLLSACEQCGGAGASIYRLPPDEILSLDSYGTNLHCGHIAKAMLNPIHTPEYPADGNTHVTVVQDKFLNMNYQILPDAIALQQEF